MQRIYSPARNRPYQRLLLFVDIHNHILPGVDDGATDLAVALTLARQAVEDGTDTLVATPHRSWYYRPDAPADWVRAQVAALQAALDAEAIPLRIVPGVEIPVGPDVAGKLAAGELLTLGDAGVWALIEPPFDRIPHDALDNLRAVQDAGFQIVLAHPERNAEVQRHLAFVEACADCGIAFQLTTGSLLGRFGPAARRAAQAILARASDWPLVIASDSHDPVQRPPNLMVAARDLAAARVGMPEAQAMVDSRPRAMITPKPAGE